MNDVDFDYYRTLRYKIVLTPEDDAGGYTGGSWGASIPELPGCVGGGATMDEALAMLNDAKIGWLTSRLKHGDPIPEPLNPAR